MSEPARRLSVNQITTKPLDFEQSVRAYVSAGMDGVSLWWDKLVAYGLAAGVRLLRDEGVAVPSVVGVPFLLSDEQGRPADMSGPILRVLDGCAAAGVGVVGLVPGNGFGRSRRDMEGATEEILSRLGPEAFDRGLRLALEPIRAPYFDFLNTLADAHRLVTAVDHPSVGILFDTWHLCHEPDLEARIAASIGRISLVHFSDWREPTRCHDDRLVPGEGVMPLASILRQLDRAGYGGFYDVEICSEDVWRADPQEILSKCRTFFDAVWA